MRAILKKIKIIKQGEFNYEEKISSIINTGIMAAAMTACGSSNSGTDNSGSTDGTAKTESSADAGSDWDNTRDITVVSREDGSGTRGAFVELFGIEEEVNGEKVRYDNRRSKYHKQYFCYDVYRGTG